MPSKDIDRVQCFAPHCEEVWPAKWWLEPRDFHQYRADGWGYIYTDTGIRHACPNHKEQGARSDAAV